MVSGVQYFGLLGDTAVGSFVVLYTYVSVSLAEFAFEISVVFDKRIGN